jgi:hypothetical protein
MVTPGVEQMYETCRFVAKASRPLFRMDRVGLAEVRFARLPSSQSQQLALASAVCPSEATSIGEWFSGVFRDLPFWSLWWSSGRSYSVYSVVVDGGVMWAELPVCFCMAVHGTVTVRTITKLLEHQLAESDVVRKSHYPHVMSTFLYRCPNTDLRVRAWTDHPPIADDLEAYQSVKCVACSRLHWVSPRTGRVLERAGIVHDTYRPLSDDN